MRAEIHFSPDEWGEIGAPNKGMWVLQPKRPACFPVLVVSTGSLHCFSLLSHYCWLCFLVLSVSRTYSFQHSRHLESTQVGAPELATEALRKLDCTGRGVPKARWDGQGWVVSPEARPSLWQRCPPRSQVPAIHRPLVVFRISSLLD